VIMGVATSINDRRAGSAVLFSSGNTAAVVSGVIALIFAGLISRARPGGWSTWVQTYGVLIGVGAIATVAGRLT